MLACIAALACCSQFRTTLDAPIAIRGGVILLPLVREDPAVPWPESLALTTESGGSLEGVVAFLVSRRDARPRSWTQVEQYFDAIPARGRREAPENSGAVLLVPAPIQGGGALRLDGQEIRPRWEGPVQWRRVAASPPEGVDWQPDSLAPSERFRWALLSRRLSIEVPPPESPESDLLARHFEGLWLFALDRVRRAAPEVGADLVAALTGLAQGDGGGGTRTIAAWQTRRDQLNLLLDLLLAPGASDEEVVRGATAWLAGSMPLAAWIGQENEGEVVVALANPMRRAVSVRLAWAVGKQVPVAAVVPAGALVTVQVPRPMGVLPGQPAELSVESDGQRQTLRAGPAIARAVPPGLPFGLLLPPLRLADVRAASVAPPEGALRTTASLRHRPKGWEVFVDCLSADGERVDDLVMLRVGLNQAVTVQITRHGLRSVEGVGTDERPQVWVATSDTGWRARVLLPKSWIPASGPLALALGRMVAGGEQVAGLPVTPWDPSPRSFLVDLSGWGSISPD